MAHDTQAIAASLTANVIASSAAAEAFLAVPPGRFADEVVILYTKIHDAVSNSAVRVSTASPRASGCVSTSAPKAS